MAEAMRQVRDVLGEDAIIVTTREEPGGVRITAAVEQEPETTTPLASAQMGAVFAPRNSFDTQEAIEQITETLMRHRVPAALTEKIVSAALRHAGKDTASTLSAALEHCFSFAPLEEKSTTPVILVGPPGAGKTLTAAKLAARSVMRGIRPVVISTDTVRAGGTDQLQAFLRILTLDLHVAPDTETVRRILQAVNGSDPVIIDTGGLNPFDPQEMKELAGLLSIQRMEPVLVLQAGMDAEESAEMALTFSVVGAKKLLATRLDFARRLGGILNAADKAGLALTLGSHTSQVAEGLMPLTAQSLTEFLMPQASKKSDGRKSA